MGQRRSQSGVREEGRRPLLAVRKERALPAIDLGRVQLDTSADARRKPKSAVFLPEPGSGGATLRVKWMVSTCLAGTVALAVIGVAIYASMNFEGRDGVIRAVWDAGLEAAKPVASVLEAKDPDQSSASAKSDRIQVTALGFTTRQIIHDTQIQKRGAREFTSIKPYARIVARLGTAQPEDVDQIPAFNPFKLYSNTTPVGENGILAAGKNDISLKILDLVGNVVPGDDRIELANTQILDYVKQANDAYHDAEDLPSSNGVPDGIAQLAVQQVAYRPDEGNATEIAEQFNTTVMHKRDDEEDVVDGSETKALTVKPGDTLMSLVIEAGADTARAKAIADAMRPVFPPSALKAGHEIRLTMVPVASDTGQMEPVKLSVFAKDKHQVTIARDGEGDYVASDEPIDLAAAAELRTSQYPQRASLYTSFYHAMLSQKMSADQIDGLIRVLSNDVDFKKKVKPGDSIELFLDTPESEAAQEAGKGEILFLAMTVEGTPRRFWRYRSPDGIVDFYDEAGNSAKKFLMRTPVRGGRYTSGFGMRRHPLLGYIRMHSGVDWAAPPGTPIVAAGDGQVESVGRYRGYGNYVRIRHTNGFATAYGHMSRYASGLVPGINVKQGQIIGYVGTTGLSSGPHLHYEIFVNNRQVNPMTIQTPRGLQLGGRPLAEFQKERRRIDGLMQLSPVTTRVASVTK